MKKLKRTALFAALLTALCAFSVSAASDGYSTENDPLVTLSYVEKVKSQIYDEVMAELEGEIERRVAEALAEAPAAKDRYEVVSLNYGQAILAGEACEMILRSGSATVVVTDKANVDMKVGLSDLTASVELLLDEEVPRNHYIIVSRGDGRGMISTSDISYLMVRGEYTIVG